MALFSICVSIVRTSVVRVSECVSNQVPCRLVFRRFIQYVVVTETAMGAERDTAVISTYQRRLTAKPSIPATFLIPLPYRTAKR
jgi:hypothetical protein